MSRPRSSQQDISLRKFKLQILKVIIILQQMLIFLALIVTAYTCGNYFTPDGWNYCNWGCLSCDNSLNCITCCPDFYLENANCFNCSTLFRNCFSCNSTRCLTCYSGYYLNASASNLQCVTCGIINCSTCADGPTCTACNTGYFVQNNAYCKPCIYPCATCTSQTVCSSCDATGNIYILDSNACVTCNLTAGAKNCTQCSISVGVYSCYACAEGFYHSGTSCLSCVDPCVTCTTVSTCQSCTSKYVFVQANTSCVPCASWITSCQSCLNQNICSQCQLGYFLSFLSKCLPCTDVVPHCSQCTPLSCSGCETGYSLDATNQCIICVSGYYFNGSDCLACPAGCTGCLSPSLCLNCAQNYTFSSGSCLSCLPGQYYSSLSANCLPCPPYCLTCDFSACLSCSELFQLQTIDGIVACVQICGDGFAVTNPCDLPLSQLITGCDNQCQIQAGFNCSLTPISYTASNGTVLSVNKSICSFLGPIFVAETGCQQSIFQNTMKLKFKIVPYLEGMPLTTDPLSSITSIIVLNCSVPIQVQAAAIDTQQSTVELTFLYFQSLANSSFTLLINFDYLSTQNAKFANLNNFTYSFLLKKNQFFGQYFAESELFQSKLVYTISKYLSIGGLALFLLGMFSKQLAGIQQMVLFQSIFVNAMFDKGQGSLVKAALSGFRYSLAIWFSGLKDDFLSCQEFLLNQQFLKMSSSFVMNFLLFIVPLLAVIFLLYRLKHKHFPFKQERGRLIEQYFRGEALMSASVFNFFGTVIFSKVSLLDVYQLQFFDSLIIIASITFTIYALYTYHTRPEMVGNFRSAFRTTQEQQQTTSSIFSCLKRLLKRKFLTSYFGQFYQKHSANFYYVFIIYLLASSLVIVFQLAAKTMILIALQSFMLVLLVCGKPYSNSLQAMRSSLAFTILLIANWTAQGWNIVWLVVGGCCLHFVCTMVVVISSFAEAAKKKCNDRSKIVMKMFKEEEQLKAAGNDEKVQIQRQAFEQIIQRYNQMQRQKPHLVEAQNHYQEQLKQEAIIQEQNTHLRYKNAMLFFDKYGKSIQKDIVGQHYHDI